MARTQDQKRWRANTACKRVEVYLPPNVVNQLDALAAERGQQRPAVIAALIDAAAPKASSAPEQVRVRGAAFVSPSPSETPADEAPALSSSTGYRMGRPRSADEKRYDWIIVTDDGQRNALGPDPVRFWRWYGRYLDASMFVREAKGNTRDEVARKLIDSPISRRYT